MPERERLIGIPQAATELDKNKVLASVVSDGHYTLTFGDRVDVTVTCWERKWNPTFPKLGIVPIHKRLLVSPAALDVPIFGDPSIEFTPISDLLKTLNYEYTATSQIKDSARRKAREEEISSQIEAERAFLARSFLSRRPYAELVKTIDLQTVQDIRLSAPFTSGTTLTEQEKETVFFEHLHPFLYASAAINNKYYKMK